MKRATLKKCFHDSDVMDVLEVSPNVGVTTGGTVVTLAGRNFVAPLDVLFGVNAASNVQVVSSTVITCTTPAMTATGRPNIAFQRYGMDYTGSTVVFEFAGEFGLTLIICAVAAEQFAMADLSAVTLVDPDGGPSSQISLSPLLIGIFGTNFIRSSVAMLRFGVDSVSYSWISVNHLTFNLSSGSPGEVRSLAYSFDGQHFSATYLYHFAGGENVDFKCSTMHFLIMVDD